MMTKKIGFLFILMSVLVISGCSGIERTVNFKAGDIKDDFCGVMINFQYCKCAFHNDYCDAIGLSRGTANDYVRSEYDKWVDGELQNFQADCQLKGGIVKNKKCVYCQKDYVVDGDQCVKIENVDDQDEATNEQPDDVTCRYDSECPAICENNIAWKQGCNPREGICEKTFETDCATDVETFGDYSFAKTCAEGVCVRDDEAIANKKQELVDEQKLISDEVKSINTMRDNLNEVMLEANKNCLNGIADMTNVAIMEFATRIASLAAGGLPDMASVAVDYVGDGLNKLYAYVDGEPADDQKLAPNEYIKLNCGLYDYFKAELTASGDELDKKIERAKQIEADLELLP